jgi:hypothetical protein
MAVICTVSPESVRVAADMAQLQLDKIAEIQRDKNRLEP